MVNNFSKIIDPDVIVENEQAARQAYEKGNYIMSFLLIHSLVEGLLRTFLEREKRRTFNELINDYESYLKKEGQEKLTFVEELKEFNKRRNRVVHSLWEKGYNATNDKLEPACRASFTLYGLFIEWLETFDPEIIDKGFRYE